MNTAGPFRLGTRGSRLALAQARIVAEALAAVGSKALETVVIETSGDRLSRRRPVGGPLVTDGQFTAELEAALADGRIDAAVHSYKDLPTDPREGLVIPAVLERGDPRDALVLAEGGSQSAGADEVFERLPRGARVATSSPRRAAQLKARRDDLVTLPIRGNVDTRLARLRRGEFEALLVAAAALDRLGAGEIGVRLPYDAMLPAPAQAALAVQCRAGDDPVAELLTPLDHAATRLAVDAERALLRAIGGGCLAALGCVGEVHDGRLRLRAAYEHDGGAFARADVTGSTASVPAVVAAAADALRAGVEVHA